MASSTIGRSWIGTNDSGAGLDGTALNVAYMNALADAIDALFAQTGGITLNQAGGDDQILTFESSDVAHGMTDYAATDVYAAFYKVAGASGGLLVRGFTEATRAQFLQCFQTTVDTAKSTSAQAALTVDAVLKSGTGVTALSADANLAVFTNNGAARFILDGDGDSHQDVGTAWTNFDAYDDVALLTALSGAVSRQTDPVRAGFMSVLAEHRSTLERARIVTINDQEDGDGAVFINWSRTLMLLVGAVRQVGSRLSTLETAIAGGR